MKTSYKIIFLSLTLIGAVLIIPANLSAQEAQTADKDLGASLPKVSVPLANPNLSVGLPGFSGFRAISCDTPQAGTGNSSSCVVPWLADFINALFRYGVGVIILLGVVVMMIGGVIWLTAAGKEEKISDAKGLISGSVLGIVIAMSSYIILNIINPALTVLSPLKIKYIEYIKLDTEEPIVGGFVSTTTSQIKDGANISVYNAYTPDQSSLLSYFIATAHADGSCAKLIKVVPNRGQNLSDYFFSNNNVPKIYCPRSGGTKEIRKIVDSIASAGGGGGIITYRYGGKGDAPLYQDGDAGGDHRCNKDPECAEQIKGHEDEANNCKYCCPEGQACVDCSAFVNHVLSCAGLPIIDSGTSTMNSCSESEEIKSIDVGNSSVNGTPLVPGDLLVLKGHVVIYTGNGETAESAPGDNDEGRRPGKGLIIQNLANSSHSSSSYLTVVRSSTLVPGNSTCKSENQKCNRNKDCCGQLLCEDGLVSNNGKCARCIREWHWNCVDDSDCCTGSSLKCVDDPDGNGGGSRCQSCITVWAYQKRGLPCCSGLHYITDQYGKKCAPD